MDVAAKLRRIRGQRKRSEMVAEICERSGIEVSPQQLYNVDTGRQPLRVAPTVRALVTAYPELALFFFGSDMVRSIVQHYGNWLQE